MNRSNKIAVGLISYAIAQGLLVLGIALLMDKVAGRVGIEVALMLMAAGTLIVMGWVFDRLVPDAGKRFTGTLKLVTAAVFFVASSLMFLSVFTGRYDLILPA